MDTKYYVYIAKCRDNTYYTGYTLNLKQRQDKHNKGEGARYTKYRLPIKIIYSESFDTITEALRREKAIKALSRVNKEKLIQN